MIVVTILSTAVAAGATAAVATRVGISEWAALAVLLNPGVWLSVRLLTIDTLALASDDGWAHWPWGCDLPCPRRSFALSVLAKDVYRGHADRPRRQGAIGRRWWVLAGISLLVLLAWMTWLTVTLGDGFTGRGNLALPFVGIVDGSANWPNLDLEELVYLGFGLVSVVAGIVVGVGSRAGCGGRSWAGPVSP